MTRNGTSAAIETRIFTLLKLEFYLKIWQTNMQEKIETRIFTLEFGRLPAGED